MTLAGNELISFEIHLQMHKNAVNMIGNLHQVKAVGFYQILAGEEKKIHLKIVNISEHCQ